MAPDNRRDHRYRAQLTTVLSHGGENVTLVTNDVSFRGAFIVSGVPASLRQLVRVSLLLPDHHEVSGHAMVVHVLGGAPLDEVAARSSGFGIEFFGQISGRARWDAFIQDLTRDPMLRLP